MLRQYAPGRHRYETIRGRTLAVGTVPIGTIYRARHHNSSRARSFIVEAWLPREYAAINQRARTAGTTYLGRGGHLAIVRDLGNNTRSRLADHHILRHVGD